MFCELTARERARAAQSVAAKKARGSSVTRTPSLSSPTLVSRVTSPTVTSPPTVNTRTTHTMYKGGGRGGGWAVVQGWTDSTRFEMSPANSAIRPASAVP